jgi:O-antigen/teichoic acid export membrane protein
MADNSSLISSDIELTFQHIKHRSASGLMVLISRSVFLQLVALGGFFFLSTFLTIEEIGLFFAVNEIIAILGYFSDIGLAAALIQRQKSLTLADIRTTFTIQQILVTILCLLVVLLTPRIATFFNFSQSGIWLLQALTVGFFLASLKTIPSVLLERQLKFDKLVIVETAETIIFYLIAVSLSWRGYGIASYAAAVLARGLIGAIIIYSISPWSIGFAFSKTTIRELMNFGLPYQANTIIALIKDRFLNLLLFRLIGAGGMGIIGWAQTWSQKPLRFLSDNITKVTFPAFSRLQKQPNKLARTVNKMLFFSSVLIFPTLIGAGLLAQPLIDILPRYQKWQPALFAFYLYLFNSGWAAISTPITNTLAAIGHIKLVSKLMIMWTVLTWTIIAPLAYFYGYNGVALGVAIVSTSSIVPIYLLHRHVKFNFINNVLKPLIAGALMGVTVLFTLNAIPANNYYWQINRIITAILTGIISYSILLHFITGRELIPQIKLFIKTIRNKP